MKEISTEQLKRELDGIHVHIDSICKEIGPRLEQLGKLREKAQIIYQELYNRGEVPKYEPPPIKEQIKQVG